MTSTRTSPGRTGSTRRAIPLMPPRVRKIVLTLHVIFSVGWLGIDVAMLTLGITGFTGSTIETMRESYITMERFGDLLVIPAGFCAVLTGLLLGLGTPWGLLRHYWVTVKLLLGLGALTLVVFALRVQLHDAASLVSRPGASTDIGFVGTTLVIAPSVALLLYTGNVVLSIFKPWGRTSYGKRKNAESVRRISG
ncbi:MAG: hypothetical protein JWO67_5927 [Streptosporangiaceae bacterium]|jgi:hypothetical protein|nr:hypothetical protein [Streptosporangiaceae bacterium]